MRHLFRFVGFLALLSLQFAEAEPLSWLPDGFPDPSPDGLCARSYLTPEMGAILLDSTLQEFSTKEKWEAYKTIVQQRILQGAGLDPMPKRTPLKALSHSRREYTGYSVENVSIESVPGYWVTGNLYRPLYITGKVPAILSTHGHSRMPQKPKDWSNHGRFNEQTQSRCAALASMGAIVFNIDMFGYGDGIELLGTDAHGTTAAMRMQVWNAVRSIDYLESLPEVDPQRLAVTGASGGGTQAFLLALLDERIAASVPVVMASSYFFGGCACESGRPIHRSEDHFVSNIMIAAMAAPRPMLLVSDGGDWTVNTPLVEYPYSRSIYRLYESERLVENAHFENEGHDYGPSKRDAVYRFFANTFDLDLSAILDSQGVVDESNLVLEPAELMRVYDRNHLVPAHAVRTVAGVNAAIEALQF